MSLSMYKSYIHLFNVIGVILRNKGVVSNEDTDERILYVVYNLWNLEKHKDLMKKMRSNNAYEPTSILTWIARTHDFNSAEEYADIIESVIEQFKKLIKFQRKRVVFERRDELNLILRNTGFNSNVKTISWKDQLRNRFSTELTNDFLEDMRNMMLKSGVYFLYDEDKELIYVGKSINLGDRIPSSINERSAIYYEYAETKSESDTSIYEAYYISLLKPELNVEGKHEDELTVRLNCIRNNELKPIYKEPKEVNVSG